MDVSCVVVPSQVEVYTLQCARAAIFIARFDLAKCHVRARLRVRKLFLIETYRFFIAKTGPFSQPNDHPVPDDENTSKAGIMEKRHPSPQPVPTVPDP